ncbi:hypothetical protein FRC00_014241 [Tulasnella sp. 408]|nr:hypothetical protein FRC00_014241 [Tulasnella sp. 408]
MSLTERLYFKAPAKLALSVEDKAKVKSAIPQDSAKIISAFLVTMHNAHPDPSKWAYTGQEGALVLIVDKINGRFWFKIVDLKGTRGVTWEHQLSDDFTYYRDRATFHSFAGETYMIGFAFTKEDDANIFFKKVIGRAKYAPPPTSPEIPPTGSGVNTTSTLFRATPNALFRAIFNHGMLKVNSGRISTLDSANVVIEGLRRHARRLLNRLFGRPQVAGGADLDVIQVQTYQYAEVPLSEPLETRRVVVADDRMRTLVACTIIVSITQGWGFAVFPPFFKDHMLSQTMFDSRSVLLPTIQVAAMMLTSGFSGRFFLFSALLALHNTRNPPTSSSITWFVKEQVCDPRFWFLALSIMFTAFATLQPFVFLTTFTVNTVPGISPMLAVLPLALVNLTGVFGHSIAAFLINPFPPSFRTPAVKSGHAFAGTILLAALSQLIGAFAKSYGHIVAYACVNGLFGTTFLSILPVLSTITFPRVNRAAMVGYLVIFSAPGTAHVGLE